MDKELIPKKCIINIIIIITIIACAILMYITEKDVLLEYLHNNNIAVNP